MYNNEFRPMKRAHSPDFEQNSFRGPQHFRGPPGGGHPFNKRHRNEAYNQPQTLEERISRLGDTGSRNNEIGVLAKEIDGELANKVGEDEKIKNLTTRICHCIIAFPTRVATYATLIGLISVKHYNLSCQIINTLHASYPVYLEAQKWQEALTIIHLLSTLVNCKVIRPTALISQFELLLEIANEDNVPQARADYYVYTVLSSLPFVAQELATQEEPTNFDKILITIEAYLGKRSKDHLNVTRVWQSGDSTVQMDYLDSLWVQTKNFRANNWNEVFLHRPYNDKEYKDIMASSLIAQNSPTIQIPAHCQDYVYPPPRIVFRLFEDDVTDGHRAIPGSDKIERFCIENHIRNIIDEIPTEPRDCARHLSHMIRSEQLPMKHLLIETILGELFTIPNPKHEQILYHTLLFEFTKIFTTRNPDDPKLNFDVILNDAVKILYDNLETMNVISFTRFVQWFSFHLNNTEFIFPWQSWSDATCKEASSPKTMFVRDILEHCVRFSFHKKISALVQAHLSNLMPVEVSVNYEPEHKDNLKAEELSNLVKRLITQKADPPTICENLNILIDGVKMPDGFELKEEKHSEKMLKIDIFAAVILSIASKSLTHLSSAVGKFRNIFKELVKVEDGQAQLLRTAHSCTQTHSQLLVILVDKFLKAELVEAREVCLWIFSNYMKPNHFKSYTWELLINTTIRSRQALKNAIRERDAPVEEPPVKEQTSEGSKESGEDPAPKETTDVEMKVDSKEDLVAKVQKHSNSYHQLLHLVFNSFTQMLTEHVKRCESSGTNYTDNWFRWITGRMQEVYYHHYEHMQKHYDEFKSIIDATPNIGSSITNLNE